MICPMKYNTNTIDPDGNIIDDASCQCEGNQCKWFPVCDRLLDVVDAILYPRIRIDKGAK